MASVSVVVPCFRCADTIERAVRSALGQTVPVREIVLVDDCSGDGTADRLLELQRAIGAQLIKVVLLPENLGQGDARNAGWEAAGGEYIAFLDADDEWHPRKLEIQLGYMREHPEFALSGHGVRWLRAGEPAEESEFAPGHCEITPEQVLWSNPFTTSSVLVRRDVPQRFPVGQRFMEDHWIWLKLVRDGQRAARLDAVLTYRYTAPFGEAGVSGQMLRMERGDLANYRRLYREGEYGVAKLAALLGWSLAKFARRVAIAGARQFFRRGRPA